jgi:hypothetical protein
MGIPLDEWMETIRFDKGRKRGAPSQQLMVAKHDWNEGESGG